MGGQNASLVRAIRKIYLLAIHHQLAKNAMIRYIKFGPYCLLEHSENDSIKHTYNFFSKLLMTDIIFFVA